MPWEQGAGCLAWPPVKIQWSTMGGTEGYLGVRQARAEAGVEQGEDWVPVCTRLCLEEVRGGS